MPARQRPGRALARDDEGRRGRRRSVHRPRCRHRVSRLLGVGRRQRPDRLRRQRQPLRLRLAGRPRRRRHRQDRARAVLGAVQLPRIQGADRRAAGRGRYPHLLRSRGRWVQEGQDLSGRTVGTGKPHPARRRRLRLPRARRSAHPRLGVGARRQAHQRRGCGIAAEDHERAAVVEGRARSSSTRCRDPTRRRPGREACRSRIASGRDQPSSACACRWTTRCGRSGRSPDASPAHRRPISWSSSATIAMRGCTAASIRRAAPRR